MIVVLGIPKLLQYNLIMKILTKINILKYLSNFN